MLQEFKIIISDTSCLILLDKIEALDCLKIFNVPVYITSAVQEEFGNTIPIWLDVLDPKDAKIQKLLENDLDRGEASVISLALELNNSILIIDELKGRKIVESLNLRYTGTLGLILKAKQLWYVESVIPYIEAIKKTNFRINEKLLFTLKSDAGE